MSVKFDYFFSCSGIRGNAFYALYKFTILDKFKVSLIL